MKNNISINLEVSLIEIIMSILIFAIAAVIMLNCFAIAKFTQTKANDKVQAGNIVQSNAEMIKSFNEPSDMDEYLIDNFKILNKSINETTYITYYDKNWNISNETNKEYSITVHTSEILMNSGKIIKINILAEKTKHYPFIEKSKKIAPIYEIDTMKFFPIIEGGGKNE